MKPYRNELDVAEKAARKAGRIVRKSYAEITSEDVTEKGTNDMVTVVDFRSQKCIESALRASFPSDLIIGEETLESDVNQGVPRDASRRWLIDPLDGTTNYIHAYPMFAVNIALEVDGRLALGVTYDPMRDEMFHAIRGKGSFLNGKPIRVSRGADKAKALLATGFPFRARRYLDDYLKTFRFFFNHTRGIRRAGSAALDLAYVAAGRVDAFWETTLSPWDMAAGIVLVEEAGGRTSDFFGGGDSLVNGHIVASNGAFHDWMCEAIEKVFPKGTVFEWGK
jgi:myo-inositol-1(or 4)-monophosphatase